ncbi:MAG: penicillin-binding transpeptidase domain-containing protein [Bacilli bacterium]
MTRDVNVYVKVNKAILILSLFLIIAIAVRAIYIALSPTVNGVNLQEFASNRNTNKQTLVAKRGTIYDANGNILAQNVSAYTVIAYLDSNISKNSSKPLHVVDKQMTAEKLSPIIGMEEEAILELLQKENVYQVELGPGGRGITELTKEKIELLELQGIDFIPSYKRYYPNSDFLSYTLGYAKTDEKGNIIGELGLEDYYNDILSGENGYLEYQQDRLGYKIPNTPEIRESPIDGKDIYLTIDSNVQLFVENAVKKQYEYADPEWFFMVVAEAKTGKILANSTYPSFDPNTRKIEQYLNSLVSYAYEPGSTMKIFTYMAAIENNMYDGDDTFLSGKLKIGPDTISDWNNKGWGEITYDQGFTRSSNVGVANLTQKYINREVLLKYFKKLGFGEKTGITLPKELSGKVDFYYPLDVASAGYGQGITTTPIQQIKALTAIANDGNLLNPYIVEKIIDPITKEVEYEGKKTNLGKVASKETINKIKDLMYSVTHSDMGTGIGYNLKDYELIGKTGTAQIATTSGYLSGSYIYSFAGMFPKDNPEIIIYTSIKKPKYGGSNALKESFKEVMQNISNYLDIVSLGGNKEEIVEYKISSLLNKDIDIVKEYMNEKHTELIILGDGDKIIKQYPTINTEISSKDKVFVLTNSKNITMPNIKKWSLREVLNLVSLIGIEYEIEGYGSVISQSIKENDPITSDSKLIITLEPSYVEEKEE